MTPANESTPATKSPVPAAGALHSSVGTDSLNPPTVAIPTAEIVESVAAQSVAASASVAPVVAAVSLAAPVMVATLAVPAGGMDSVLSPLLGTNPLAPVQSAMSWAMLAAARRERGGSPAAHSIPVGLVSTSDPADTQSVRVAVEPAGTGVPSAAALAASINSTQALIPVASVTAADPITAFIGQVQAFVTQIVQAVTGVVTQVVQAVTQALTAIINVFVPAPAPVNAAPVADNPTVGTPDPASGVVTGQINATDPNGDTLTYSSAATTAKGTVIVAGNGSFMYAPTAVARHTAAEDAATIALTTDSFVVTVSDGKGGTATVPITVAVGGANSAPLAGVTTVGVADTITGVVTGSVKATDADGDPLSYSTAVAASKGSVSINASTGAFTYTPTILARQTAASPGASAADKVDLFTVTITDEHGGSAIVQVGVPVSSTQRANLAPVAGATTISTPNTSTGVITGTMTATDANGDTLTYAGSTTSKGSVTVTANGNFTYTPSSLARHSAASLNASESDKIDIFTVTASDGYGGIATVSFTVNVAPENNLPSAGSQTVSAPSPSTGVVTGAVTATDLDSDSLTFSGSAATAKGNVLVDPSGSFTYTPTNIARRNAAAVGASNADKTDVFTITASDGHGGSTAIPVTVAVGLAGNSAPVAGTVTINSLDPSAGAVSGTIAAVDPDSDALAYAGSTTTSKGTVVVHPDGTFTYTPNAAAQDNLGTRIFHNGAAAFGPGYSRAYSTDVSVVNGAWLSTVSTIDVASNTVISTASFSNMAIQEIGVSPNGAHTYVINNYAQVVAADLATGAVIATISVPNYPYDFTFSPDSSRVYVRTNTGISAIDTATNTLAGNISSPQAFQLAVSPDGTKVYGASNSGLMVFDTASNTLAATIPTGPGSGIALSPDGSRVYLMTGDGVAVVDTSTNSIVTTVPLAVTSGGIAADAGHVYVTTNDSVGSWIGVSVLDATTNTVSSVIHLPTWNYLYPRVGGNSGFYAWIQSTSPGGGYDFIFVPFDQASTLARADTFAVTVNDGHGGTSTLQVGVPVIPRWQY
ncbi:MAG: Ig-like domain-containing protein [Candidatus Nanopelagicales bacterium]